MKAIVDTSFLFALTNRKDINHARVLAVAQSLEEPLLVPSVVLPEVCYLIVSRLGHKTMRTFLRDLAVGDAKIEPTYVTDLPRIYEILSQYADSRLDFVDSAIIAASERERITRVLTLDRRDFSLVRPNHCRYFEILP